MTIDPLSGLTWTLAAWRDYLYWQSQDRKTLKRIKDIFPPRIATDEHGFSGRGEKFFAPT